MTDRIASLTALEILDSRGRPTVSGRLALADGSTATAGVPSGASTGTREAVELRDGDTSRYGGAGVSRAVANVNGEIADTLVGRAIEDLAALDALLMTSTGPTPRVASARTPSSGPCGPYLLPLRPSR
jgi:enolase